MIRLFVGLAVPEQVRTRLRLMQGGIDGARWTAFENFHITLSFIGEVSEDQGDYLDEALSSVHVEPFEVSVKGTGCFSLGKDVEYLWVGVEKNKTLQRLKDKIDFALLARGVPTEKRKYTPHITVATLKNTTNTDQVGQFMQDHNLFEAEPFRVDKFTLYESKSGSEGPIYTPLHNYILF